MRRMIFLFSLFTLLPAWTQPTSARQTEKDAIQHAKGASVHTLDARLSDVSLESFLKQEGNGASIVWEVNDCGEQTGNPEADQGRDFPMCVEADMDLKDRRTVNILVVVGTFKKGLVGAPSLWSLTLSDASGHVRSVRRLGDLPAEIHGPKRKPD